MFKCIILEFFKMHVMHQLSVYSKYVWNKKKSLLFMRHRVLENGLTKTVFDHLRSNSNSGKKCGKTFPIIVKKRLTLSLLTTSCCVVVVQILPDWSVSLCKIIWDLIFDSFFYGHVASVLHIYTKNVSNALVYTFNDICLCKYGVCTHIHPLVSYTIKLPVCDLFFRAHRIS